MKSEISVYLAIDLGASSGRVMAGIYDGERIEMREIYRFPSPGLELAGSIHWDVRQMFGHVLEGLARAGARYGRKIVGLGVDAWGVDYALLDRSGQLLAPPFQYRDRRTYGVQERVRQMVSKEMLYRETGIQFIRINTVNQLYADRESGSDELEKAHHLVFIPDLFNYWLCGKIIQERTIASTSQLLNPRTGAWSEVLLEGLGFPKRLFGEITEPATRIGVLLQKVRARTGLGSLPVFAVAGHDTGSAVAGAPLRPDAPAFISSGTWSIMGMELPHPLINSAAMEASYSNEAGVEGTTRFLKNLCGMWLLTQLREEWLRGGVEYSYDQLEELAMEAEPFRSLIDPDHISFSPSGPMVQRIREYCGSRGEPVPGSPQQLLRAVFDSLACKYRIVFEGLASFAGKPLNELRVVGGGSKNKILNQFTANALNCRVNVGPVEAASLGNVLIQMLGSGVIDSLEQGRYLVEKSFPSEIYLPEKGQDWQEPVQRLRQIMLF